MRLDQLEFKPAGEYWDECKLGNVVVYRAVKVYEPNHQFFPRKIGNYTIYPDAAAFSRGATETVYRDLDPLSAQCVLYHVLGTEELT